jgi:UPF0755 protein
VTRERRAWWQPRRSRRAQRWALAVVGLSVGSAVWAAHGAYERLMSYPEEPGAGAADTILTIEVPRGASFPRVLDLLVEAGVVPAEDAAYFKLFVLHRGAASKVTAGEHTFRGDMTPTEILDELVRRQPATEVQITIPEGKQMLEVADILYAAGVGDRDAIVARMRDPAFCRELGVPADSLEGYLFPDTYKLGADSTPEQVLGRLVRRHQQVYDDLLRRHQKAAEKLERQLGWGDHEVVVLASIVERETAAKHERPLIAGVFLNRMRFSSFQPKYLATDPTIVYGCTVPEQRSEACRQFEGRIRRIHLRDVDNPYNTYTHPGLPPGPISNPGRAALEAVLAPKDSRFLYFVARNDGTHHFSKTVAEHDLAVDKYQRQGVVGDG